MIVCRHVLILISALAIWIGDSRAETLTLELVDEKGQPTAGRVLVRDSQDRIVELENKSLAMIYGRNETVDGFATQFDGAIYISNAYELDLAPGDYTISVSKGIEYELQTRRISISPGRQSTLRIEIPRWVDMPSLGWYSGDDHIHLRRSPLVDPIIAQWLDAEDVHVGILVQMGDFWRTYYPQFAFGDGGNFQLEGERNILSSGQEDPRTHELGHTLSFGADEEVRFRQAYYYYDRVFDRVHELGGLTGYAHHGIGFNGQRGMTLDVLRGKVDFLEMLQFCRAEGPLAPVYYYHFLDLGFPLTAAAGSDFPFCHRFPVPDRPGEFVVPRIGNVRFYTYVGDDYSFPKWKESFRQGRTFVTSGPMLFLDVDGNMPGDSIDLQEKGTTVSIKATALGHPAQSGLTKLELVAHGELVGSVEPGRVGQTSSRLQLDLDMEIDHGVWVAARCFAGPLQVAHTTPVYVTVDGDGFHNRERWRERLDGCEEFLKEIEDEALKPSNSYHEHAWRYADGLKERIAETRQVIADLRKKFKAAEN